jgi:hypothetical protein
MLRRSILRGRTARWVSSALLSGCLGLWASHPAAAQNEEEASAKPASTSAAKATEKPEKPESKFPEWDKVIKDAKKIDGLFSLYFNEKEQNLFMEIRQDQYGQELILPISIARGAGSMYLGGDTLNFGEQWVISFQRKADKILVIRHNLRVKADSGSPQADSIKVSYSDSVIDALPIKSEQHNGDRVLVDLADLFMTDLARIGVTPDRARSTWAKVKAFPENVEVEVSAVFNMSYGGLFYFFYGDDSVVDPRGAQIVIHYGLSKLTAGDYKPREADDRVGHFLSTVNDFSTDIHDTPKKRYVTRWQLEKSNAESDKSPPKKPIVFWVEKTVPREYRPYVRAGILEWNKAFEKLGFIEAIQVRDQTELDDFEPEDIRYNTFRWITTSIGFAMGPSRTNPKTGQILDADIVFDEGMVRYWRGEFLRTRGIPEAISMIDAGQRQGFYKLYASRVPEFAGHHDEINRLAKQYHSAKREFTINPNQPQQHGYAGRQNSASCECCMMGQGMQRQIGLMAAMMAARGTIDPGGKVPEEFLGQALKEVVMHEVGHTLGLRHNFKSSSFISLKDANNPEVTRKRGMTGSVMDYAPANFAPKDEKQGDYFSDTIGPYDYWAIEYAYKPIKGDEKEELEKIASRSSSDELTYGTDEDLYMNPDPRINAYDLGDPLEYATQRVKLMKESLDKLEDRVVAKGEGWQRARQAFSMLLGELSSAAYLSSQYVGGQYTSRAHRGEPDAKTPLAAIPVAKQREAIKLLKEEILSDDAFKFSPELLKRLPPEHFNDSYYIFFGSNYQYPLYESVLSIQQIALSRFLDGEVLRSIQNSELLAGEGEDVLKLPEIFDALTDSIWSELPAADSSGSDKPKVAISTIRRNLQREHVKRLSEIVLGPRNQMYDYYSYIFYDFSRPAPADAQALARHHLKAIDARIAIALDGNKADPDAYSRAHLEQLHDQIAKVLAAQLDVNEL